MVCEAHRDVGRTIWHRSSGSAASSRTGLWTHTTKRVSLVFHVDDLLLAGTHQITNEVLAELSRDLELQSGGVTTKPTHYLGRILVKVKEYNFGVDASHVRSMLEEFNMSALKS